MDGFYRGFWFHLTETACGQHCLKGWHLLDLLEEHALHVGTSSVRIPNAKFWYGFPRWQVVLGFQFSNRQADRLANLHSNVQRLPTALIDGWIGDPGYHQQFTPARPKILLESGCAVQEWNFAPREKVYCNVWTKEKHTCKDLCQITLLQANSVWCYWLTGELDLDENILLQVTIGHRIVWRHIRVAYNWEFRPEREACSSGQRSFWRKKGIAPSTFTKQWERHHDMEPHQQPKPTNHNPLIANLDPSVRGQNPTCDFCVYTSSCISCT